jgi:hypothetical protein
MINGKWDDVLKIRNDLEGFGAANAVADGGTVTLLESVSFDCVYASLSAT